MNAGSPEQLLVWFCRAAEALSSCPSDVLEDCLRAAEQSAAEDKNVRESVKFTEPLIIEFLRGALEKRRLME